MRMISHWRTFWPMLMIALLLRKVDTETSERCIFERCARSFQICNTWDNFHLVSKTLAGYLYESLQTVIKAVQYSKSNALQDCLSWQLCDDNNEEFTHLLLHTQVLWLSKGFVAFWDSVVTFFRDQEMEEELTSFKFDIFYLCDLLEKLSFTNSYRARFVTYFLQANRLLQSFLEKSCYSLECWTSRICPVFLPGSR